VPAAARKATDFSSVTETWGLAASPEQLSMMYSRYRFASELAGGGNVLEVGSGAGLGLRYLQGHTGGAVGLDYTFSLLQQSRAHLLEVPLTRGDAQALPFASGSFDLVLMLEMIYYVEHVTRALEEARRVLRPGGRILITTPNPDRHDFNPSPFTYEYPNVPRLAGWLRDAGFSDTVYGNFPVEAASSRDQLLAPVRHLAVRLHLIPRSMRMKALLKRMLYGGHRLDEVREGIGEYRAPQTILSSVPDPSFKVLYGVGQLP
jgi:ubiquinone/menaquinone biosynthesis C-methylase UbiE